MKQRGFTLVEVLVVVALIGVLAALGGGMYAKSLSRGRDTKRVEDMKKIAFGFESYKLDKGSYADCATMLEDNPELFPGGRPSGSKVYPYGGICTTSSFKYCAALENPANYGNASCNQDSEEIGDRKTDYSKCVLQSSGATHYCVINVQ